MKNCIEIKRRLVIQKRHYYFVVQLCFFMVLMSLGLAVATAKTAYQRQRGFYGTVSVNYEDNLSKGDISNIQLTAISQTLRHVNDNGTTGPGVTVEFGYQWPIAPHWSWSLAGQFSYDDFIQKGNAQLMNFGFESYPYQYHITTLVASAVGRLIYTRGKWQYYGELGTGPGFLNSNNYKGTPINQTDAYASKTVVTWPISLGLGIKLQVAKQTSIGFNVNYTNLGKAKLGARQISLSSGQISQALRVFSTGINITHWF